jgi:hypothetical protein
VPSAANWQWAASVNLEEELLPSIGLRQIRIPQAARANVARALLLPLKRIEADPLDEGAWTVLLLFPALVLGALNRGGGSGTRYLNARCRQFESGDWEALLAEHHEREDELAEEREEREGGAQGDGEPFDAVAYERRICRYLRLGRPGELRRAAKALIIGRIDRHPPQRGRSRLFVRAVHPAAPSPIPSWVADFQPDESFQLDAVVLSRALSTASSFSDGGPSDLLYEHYGDVLAVDPAAAFHVVCNHVARGQMPPRARAALSSCKLLAMAKPIDGQPDGVRQLAVGEVLHKFVARTVDLQLRDRFQQHFAPLQYGVATPGGCEAVVAGLRAYIEQEPQSLVLQVDLANAFNGEWELLQSSIGSRQGILLRGTSLPYPTAEPS